MHKQTQMIDIHSHVIYGADDGARTLEESIQLLQKAQTEGAGAVIATPHYKPQQTDSQSAEIREKADKLREALTKQNIKLPLYTGNEVLYFDSLTEHLRRGWVLCLADSAYVLIEFYPKDSWQKMLQAARKIRNAGYLPVFAHVERYAALREHDVRELIANGAYLQINVSSLEGGWFNQQANFCKKLIRQNCIHFLGSDMHRIDTRPPKLMAGLTWLLAHDANAEALFSKNASYILENKELPLEQ